MASERQVSQVRDKITEKKIKLWLPPYTTDGQEKGCYSKELLEELIGDTGLEANIVVDALEQLRCHAVNKLASRTKFQKTGEATLKVKIIFSSQNELPKTINFQTSLEIQGGQLKEELSKQIAMPTAVMKIIAHGKVLQDEITLAEQNVKHESQVMVLLLAAESLKEREHVLLNQARQDAELLSSFDGEDPNSQHYLQVADQTGKPLALPASERKALAIALTLHQKGRGCLKNKQYTQALFFFLEADTEFQQCSASILKLVDNYALLNLDIAWCYLCLRSLVHLPNAASRLESCQECLNRSYGTNLERLHAIKGGSSKELVLFARLHLLQGVVAYHQNQYKEASRLLNMAAQEMKDLKVDDEKLSQMMGMGYTMGESRLALRGARGNIPMAIQNIIEQKEMKAELRKKEKEERRLKKEQKRLGKTANGEWVNVQFYNMLLSMGYPHSESIKSLQQSNNNVSLAVQILQDNPDLLAMASGSNSHPVSQEQIAQLASLGFCPENAQHILEETQGNLQDALAKLMSGFISERESSTENAEDAALHETAKQAMDRLADDIPQEEEEYLDDTMAEEEAFLAEYLAFL